MRSELDARCTLHGRTSHILGHHRPPHVLQLVADVAFGSKSRANVLCSSLNNGHQDQNLVPIGGLVAFEPRSGFSVLKKLKILRMNQAHRSASSSRQRIDHPHPEGLTTRLVPVEVDLKQQIFDVCSSLQQRTFTKGAVTSALCQGRTHAPQQKSIRGKPQNQSISKGATAVIR
jgi:hypothetical protein